MAQIIDGNSLVFEKEFIQGARNLKYLLVFEQPFRHFQWFSQLAMWLTKYLSRQLDDKVIA